MEYGYACWHDVSVTVQGPNLIFSIIHFSPLSSDSPFMFTVSISFSTDDYRYMIQ